jgi:hypothetical protein
MASSQTSKCEYCPPFTFVSLRTDIIIVLATGSTRPLVLNVSSASKLGSRNATHKCGQSLRHWAIGSLWKDLGTGSTTWNVIWSLEIV